MDQIHTLGRDIAQVASPTYEIYGDLLNQPSVASAIEAVRRETFSYGPHAKQQLDIYTPNSDFAQAARETTRPVLVFFHGGGMFSGGRITPEIPGELAYKNLGHFFANKCGLDAIVAGYRLIQDGAKVPSGGDDVQGVLDWAQKYYSGSTEDNRKRDLFLLGNSAGGVHVATWLLSKQFQTTREKLLADTADLHLKGVAFLGCPFRWDISGGLKDVLVTYYGSEDQIKKAEPTSLLKQAVADQGMESLAQWPKVLVVVSELDPEDGIEIPGKEFSQLWSAAKGKVTYLELLGHNHISPPVALGTDIPAEEAWGFDIVKWMSD